MSRRLTSSACPRSVAIVLGAALSCLAGAKAEAQEASGTTGATAASEPEGPAAPADGEVRAREEEGPRPASDEDGPAKERVLVLPTRATFDGAEDAATFDVLLASALQEIGFAVADLARDPALVALAERDPSLDEARELYLGMKLEEALEAAASIRETHLAAHGVLLNTVALREAELFIVQVLLDLGRVNEALDVAVDVLVRHPQLRLDPVRYSPAMQALWLAALERCASRAPEEPSRAALTDLGVEVGVDWVAVAVREKDAGDDLRLVIILVPVRETEAASRHSIALGPRASWARQVRQALEERFPPPPAEPLREEPKPLPGEGEDGEKGGGIGKAPWYKTWWFWTLVGAVVVGGTAGGIGGYYSSRDETPAVTGDLWK